MSTLKQARNRLRYCGMTLGVILLGLASRRFPGMFPEVVGKYPGDVLWTMMVFFGLAVMMPALSVRQLTIYAAVISYVVEISQLYQAPWMNAVRANPLGHLVLGSTFNWGDLAAYTVGAVLAMLLEAAIRRN